MDPRLQRNISMTAFGVSLAIVVLCAILGAIDSERTGPYLGTAALTLLLAGFIHMSLRMCERQGSRIAGFISLGVVTTAWCFLILSIWSEAFRWGGSNTTERFGISAVAIIACWLPFGMGGIAILKPHWIRCGGVLLAGFGLVLVIWLLGLWSGRPGDDIAATIVPLAAATVLVAVLQPKTSIPAQLRQSCAVLAILAAITLSQLWLQDESTKNALLKVDFTIIALSIATMGCGVNLLIDLRLPRADWLRMVTMAMLLITLILASLMTHMEIVVPARGEMPILARLMFASILVTIALAIAVGALLRNRQALVESFHTVALSLTCPRCHRQLEVEQGEQACAWCELRFRLAFESPDCRMCGYVLAPRYPDQCPECGTLMVESPDAPARLGPH